MLLSSCSKESEDLDFQEYEGKWELVKMHGNIPDSETTGDDMEWQEIYVLNRDGTFLKTRVRNNITIASAGTYTVLDSSPEEMTGITAEAYIILNHNSESGIIATCESSSHREYLYFATREVMISTYAQCDGPGLEYRKQE